MNDDLPEEWLQHDETLADQPAEGAPPAVAQRWLLEQRFVHGLLRAMNTDAGTREQRVQAILDRTGSGDLAVGRRRVPVLLSLAAALALILLGRALVWGPEELPQAEACVSRAIERMQKPLDRRFHGTVQGRGVLLLRDRFEFSLTTRPGMRFLLEGDLARIGCDGTTVWLLPTLQFPGMKAFTAPLAQRERLLAQMGDVLDLGYLDMQALLQRLPTSFAMKVVGRETGLRLPGPQVRMVATRLPDQQQERIESLEVLFDEADGMVTRIEIHSRHLGAPCTAVLQYIGTVELSEEAYQVPR